MATQPGMVTRRRIYRAKDIADLMGISESHAYKLMAKVNKELKAQGFITVAGRVSADYFDKRIGVL